MSDFKVRNKVHPLLGSRCTHGHAIEVLFYAFCIASSLLFVYENLIRFKHEWVYLTNSSCVHASFVEVATMGNETMLC
jgi:hypothetical protein